MPPIVPKRDKERRFDMYKELVNGANFEEMAKANSDDHGTAQKGGELRWFGTGKTNPEFEEAAFAKRKVTFLLHLQQATDGTLSNYWINGIFRR